jgi:hypothetical protein
MPVHQVQLYNKKNNTKQKQHKMAHTVANLGAIKYVLLRALAGSARCQALSSVKVLLGCTITSSIGSQHSPNSLVCRAGATKSSRRHLAEPSIVRGAQLGSSEEKKRCRERRGLKNTS